MLQTSPELQEIRDAERRGPVNRSPDARRNPKTDTEVLALLCPDWRNAMFVLDVEALTVAYANIRATKMFNRRYPLFVSHGRLELTLRHGTEWLRTRLQRVLSDDIGQTTIIVDDDLRGLTYSIRIGLPQGFTRDVLHRNIENGARLVVLEVASGNRAPSRNDLDALAAAFELTSAETAILALLSQGRSVVEIAGLRGVAFSTVRNQCKQLLSKTRSRRQSDLVKLVMTLCNYDAPLTADQDQFLA
jgi:DNA-binding CsgD family transcriptional regulator